MEIQCKFDNTTHPSLEALHKHIRKFHIKQSDYYLEYYPRKDLLTKELIEFKDYNQYFNQDFKNKNNLKKWLKTNPEEGKKWAIDWLLKRKNEKGLIYAPSHVELKSLTAPSMDYFESIGGYYKITKELGFLDRYNNDKLVLKNFGDKKILVDSREQNAIKLNCKTSIAALNIGDYSLDEKNDLGIYIERKSLNDFCGTLSKGLERFEKELGRAKETNSYVVMIVESNLNDSLSFNYLPQTKWVKAQPAFIFKNLRDLLVKYPLNFQVLFAEGRKDFALKIIKIFELGNQVKKIDLQFRMENGDI